MTIKEAVDIKMNFVSGLNNLGNTCFFNSVLQNLAQTDPFRELIEANSNTLDTKYSIVHDNDYDSELSDNENERSEEDSDSSDESNDDKEEESNASMRSIRVNRLDVVLSEPPGILGKQLGDLIKNMTSSRSVINPSNLLGLFCKRVPQFKGYQQQDSHELLRNLLDCVKNEELRRRQSAILDKLKLSAKFMNKSKSNSTISDLTKKEIKRYGRLSSYTFIDELFGGHLLSSVVCSKCNNCLQRVEPFLDLSLPINIRTEEPKLMGIPQLPGRLLRSTAKKLSRKEQKWATKKQTDFIKTDENDNVEVSENEEVLSKHMTKKQMKQASKKSKKGKRSSRKKEDEKTVEDADQETNNLTNPDLAKSEQIENGDSKGDEKLAQNEITSEKEVELEFEKPCESIETEDKSNAKEDNENTQKLENLTLEDTIENSADLKNEFRLEGLKSLSDRSSIENSGDFTLTLQACLAKFTAKEDLNDKIECEKCTKDYNSQRRHLSNSKTQKVYTKAVKQYLICNLPAVLTIHLKRFLQHGHRLEKSNKQVEFPLELDVSPHVSRLCINTTNAPNPLYSLYGLVEHSGKLNSGHYTAFVRIRNEKNSNREFLTTHRLCHLKKMFGEWKANRSVNKVSHEAQIEEIVQEIREETGENKSNGQNDKWFYISDSHVAEVNTTKVLKAQAYILFYERIQ